MIRGIQRWIEETAIAKSLTDTRFFERITRRIAYHRANGDPESVHELALEALVNFENVVEKISSRFDFPYLHVDVAGKKVIPFGIAAGLDKNGDALYPLGKLFGFLEPGTVVVPSREGNTKPRVTVDNVHEEIYNAQGFPSKGLEHFLRNISKYRRRGGKTPVLASVCGIPQDPESVDAARQELEVLVSKLAPFVDGFVWNPYSPNTEALTALRTPEEFRRSAELMKRHAEGKPLLVKMGPYESVYEQKLEWLNLIGAFMKGGGTGIVASNTLMVPQSQVPAKNWGYKSAGRSGAALSDYRQRAITDARSAFPDIYIIATGGIDSAEEALAAFHVGANVLEGYTPYTFHGFGLLLEMALGLQTKLQVQGYQSLAEFQAERASKKYK